MKFSEDLLERQLLSTLGGKILVFYELYFIEYPSDPRTSSRQYTEKPSASNSFFALPARGAVFSMCFDLDKRQLDMRGKHHVVGHLIEPGLIIFGARLPIDLTVCTSFLQWFFHA